MEDKNFALFIIFKGKAVFLKSIENTQQGLNRYGMRNIIMNEMLVGLCQFSTTVYFIAI